MPAFEHDNPNKPHRVLKLPHGFTLDDLLSEPPDEPLPNIAGFDRLYQEDDDFNLRRLSKCNRGHRDQVPRVRRAEPRAEGDRPRMLRPRRPHEQPRGVHRCLLRLPGVLGGDRLPPLYEAHRRPVHRRREPRAPLDHIDREGRADPRALSALQGGRGPGHKLRAGQVLVP
jgi:hypothetical protein